MINRHAVLELVFRGLRRVLYLAKFSGIGRMGIAVFGFFLVVYNSKNSSFTFHKIPPANSRSFQRNQKTYQAKSFRK